MSGISGAVTKLRGRVDNAVKAVREAATATQALFERHNLVFTIGASIASAAAAWAGYMAREHNQRKLDERLKSIEHAMATVHEIEAEQVKAIAQTAIRTPSGLSYKTCGATALTTFLLGYGLGFRGGRRYTLRRLDSKPRLRLPFLNRGKQSPAAEKATPVESKPPTS